MRVQNVKRCSIYLFFLIFGFETVFGLDESIYIGPQDNWSQILSMENSLLYQGSEGDTEIRLKDAEYSPGQDTDFLQHFNYPGEQDAAGKYTGSPLEINRQNARFGLGAGIFRGDAVSFIATPDSLFAGNRYPGDFTIEFWIYPVTMNNGELIFLWQGARESEQGPLSQRIHCTLQNRKLLWHFRNIFIPPDKSDFVLELEGKKRLIPQTWHHHLIRYNSDTGMLEYLIDNVPEAIGYANYSNEESAQIFQPFLGTSPDKSIQIGQGYTGLVDEFRITSGFVTEPGIEKYSMDKGIITSAILDLQYTNSPIRTVTAGYTSPGNTAAAFWLRTADEIRLADQLDSDWVRFYPSRPFGGVHRGRYLQLRVELYPDGTGRNTPTLQDLRVYYTPDLPPLPPGDITAIPGNGKVTLKWRQEGDYDIQGYYIFFGIKPELYTGLESVYGSLPLDAGNTDTFVIDGLDNGTLYYFSVIAYDYSEPPHMSVFSKEVSARPTDFQDGK